MSTLLSLLLAKKMAQRPLHISPMIASVYVFFLFFFLWFIAYSIAMIIKTAHLKYQNEKKIYV